METTNLFGVMAAVADFERELNQEGWMEPDTYDLHDAAEALAHQAAWDHYECKDPACTICKAVAFIRHNQKPLRVTAVRLRTMTDRSEPV